MIRTSATRSVFSPSLGDVWLIHRSADDSLALVANRRPQIPTEAMGYMMSIEYKARDGLKIQAILTVPPNYDPNGTSPLPTTRTSSIQRSPPMTMTTMTAAETAFFGRS